MKEETAVSPPNSSIERKEYELFLVEVFSQGKTLKTNEDIWVTTPHLVGVVDGTTAKTPLAFDGRTSGEYASYVTGRILASIEPGVYGKQLVNTVTQQFNDALGQLGLAADLEKTPHARPTASFVAACVLDNKIIVTQIGDVAFRVNGEKVYENSKEIDGINARMRIDAIKKAEEENPDLPVSELMQTGRNAIVDSLHTQVSVYQNNPDHPLGFGVIDGRIIPDKYINVYEFNLGDVSTLEIFSDGYFKVADEPTTASWEQGFAEVEKEDPYKMDKYPSTKGSNANSFTDDRTVLIARFI